MSGILLLRTYAIWENNTYVAGILFFILLGMCTGVGYFVERFLTSLDCEWLLKFLGASQ
jgi:general stress protein CsbA